MENIEKIRIGKNFLGLLNDLKRRPEDAATELGLPLDYILDIIKGKKELSSDIIKKATEVWPINHRDFFIIRDDCYNGVRIMRRDESEKSSRIMSRAGYPYYEYRDTAMSCVGPFRPEWIKELCIVGDNEPTNQDVQWNNGHFMHQFTYFIGDVNFYYIGHDGEKKVAVMRTGDSNYITPFTPHSFATRKGSSTNGLILALTYGNNLMGDAQQELSALGNELGPEFVLDFSSTEKAIASLLYFHLKNSSVGIEELSTRTAISVTKIKNFLDASSTPSHNELKSIAKALDINLRDLFPYDEINARVIIQKYENAKHWFYPDFSKSYEMIELASTVNLPYSKALEINILNNNGVDLDLKVGLHQYGYNVGKSDVQLNWKTNDNNFSEFIRPGDSFYIKPFVNHSFRGKGKLLVLRIGGKIAGESQLELSLIGKENVERAINETMQWFDPEGKN